MRTVTSLLAMCAVAAACVGCGDGAYEPSNVTLKPSTAASGAATDGNAAGSSNTSATNGGTSVAASGFGTFRGRVTLTGTAPGLPPKVAQGANVKDAQVCAVNPVPNEKFVVGPDSGLANVFIYSVKAPKNGKPQAGHEEATPVFSQKGCVFVPHAMVLRVGKEFSLASEDAVPHNVHSRPNRAREINDAVDPGKQRLVSYDKSEVEPASVGCDFHNWMQAYHLPLDHPYGIVTAADGTFEMQDLPVGTHSFRIWHEGKAVNNNYQVTITMDGEVVEKTIELSVAQLE